MESLDVVVLGELSNDFGDLRDEASKAKAALLYGDRILVKSHKVPLLLGAKAAATRLIPREALKEGIDQEMIDAIIASLEAQGIENIPAGDILLQTLRSDHPQVFFEVPEMICELLREKGSLDGELYFRQSVLPAVEGYLRGNDLDGRGLLSAAKELVQLNESGLVGIDTAGAQNLLISELDDIEDAFRRSIQTAVETFSADPMDHPLFTAGAKLRIKAAGSAAAVSPSARKASRAELAASMLADIPSLPTATVDEILDIRERVSPHLSRFRAAVADLEEELNTNVGAEDFAVEVEDLKLRHVAPALEELNESIRDEGIGPTAARSAPVLASGVLGLGASVAMGAPDLASVVAVSAGATTAVAREIVERSKLDRERKKHRLFLLFDIGRHLSRHRRR